MVRRSRTIWVRLVFAVAFGWLFAGIPFFAGIPSLYAQSDVSDDQVNEVASEMFCPTCENTPLDVCPTQTCADWRELIRQQLDAGMSKAQIHLYFADQYGDHVLAEPPRRGFDLALWVVPILAVVAGGWFLLRYARAIQAPSPASAAPPAPPPPADDYVTQIEQELRDRS